MSGERYRRIERIGSGGMASVWRAEDTQLDREVAIKVISDNLAHDEAFMRRFDREARVASSLSHPNLVPVFDYVSEADQPYIVMELLTGGTLADMLEDGAEVDIEALTRGLLGALGHIHAAGIVHRDVKPANVLVDESGRFRLTDFGIAITQDATRYTQAGYVVGTLRYMAPEVKAGEPATPRSDLYSAGAVIRRAGGEGGGALAALTAEEPEKRPPDAETALAMLDGETTVSLPSAGAGPETHPTAVLSEETTSARATGRRLGLYLAAAGMVLAAVLAVVLLGGGDEPAADRNAEAQRERPATTTVTATTTEPEPVQQPPATNPAGKAPPGQQGQSCEQLEERKSALKDERKAAEGAAKGDKEARDAVKEEYKEREGTLNDQIKVCKETEQGRP